MDSGAMFSISAMTVSFVICVIAMNPPVTYDLLSCLRETVAAINRPVGFRLERDLSLVATVGADCREVLPGAARCGFSVVATCLAALGFVLETALGIKLLLAAGEHELGAAFFTYQCFVFVHF